MHTSTVRGMRALALVAVVAAGAACAPAINRVDIEAAQTAARVKTALVNDPVVGVRVINVAVVDGTVVLSGRVTSADEAALAVQVARGVAGVQEVASRLLIGDEPPIDPDVTVRNIDPTRDVAYEFAELRNEPQLLAVGASIGWSNQQARQVGARVSISPLIKLGSGRGWGPAIAFDWYSAILLLSPDARVDSGRARVRPVMGGVRYTLPVGRVALSPSVVAGYAFNSIRVPETGEAERLPVGVDDSFIWRPGVSVSIDTGRRTLVHLSVGRLLTSPRVTFVDGGVLREEAVSGDTTVVSIGVAYKIF